MLCYSSQSDHFLWRPHLVTETFFQKKFAEAFVCLCMHVYTIAHETGPFLIIPATRVKLSKTSCSISVQGRLKIGIFKIDREDQKKSRGASPGCGLMFLPPKMTFRKKFWSEFICCTPFFMFKIVKISVFALFYVKQAYVAILRPVSDQKSKSPQKIFFPIDILQSLSSLEAVLL